MRCLESSTDLNAFFDGELSLAESVAFERHLEGCPECRQLLAINGRVRTSIVEGSLHYRAPAALRARIEATLPRDTTTIAMSQGHPPGHRVRWAAIAAALVIAGSVIFATVWAQSRPGRDDLLAQEVVAGHIRSLMASHLTDVPSLDRHTVKPWFDGKLDFAPPVVDASAGGFPLIGGRLDYVDDRPVAALIYKRQQHVINLFIWPSGESERHDRVLVRQGYNLVHWDHAGMTFWAVSDLELPQLQQFAQAMQNPT